jgi:hypothetical protein
LTVAFIVALITGIWGTLFGGNSVIASWLDGRQLMYGTLASISSALLGFLIATITIMQGVVNSDGFQRLRESDQYPTLWRVFIVAIRFLGLTTALTLVGLVADTHEHPIWPIAYLTWWAVLSSALLVARSLWILERILKISTDT